MFEGIKVEGNITPPKIAREITVLEADPSLIKKDGDEVLYLAPEVKMTVFYAPKAVMQKILAPIQNKKKINDNDENRFRTQIVDHCWSDWSGITLTNLTRMSEWCLLNIDILRAKFEEAGLSDTSEIPFAEEDARWVASVMNVGIFAHIMEEINDLEQFAVKQAETQKN